MLLSELTKLDYSLRQKVTLLSQERLKMYLMDNSAPGYKL